MRFATLRDLDRAGLDLRLWCYRCGHCATMDSIVWELFDQRDWSIAIPEARARFRCTACGERDVLLVPTRRPKRDIGKAATELVAGYFHRLRSAHKRRKAPS